MTAYTYNDSALKRVIQYPKTVWDNTSLYTFVLMSPVLLLVFIISFPAAIVIDFITALFKTTS